MLRVMMSGRTPVTVTLHLRPDTVVTLSSEMSSAAGGVNKSNKHGTVMKSSRWLRDSRYK